MIVGGVFLFMAKDPAFLFYPGDFNTGTQFFTDEQVGKYIRLLMAQHQHGHLSEKHVLHICKTYDKDILNKFIKDSEGLWYNERLENEIIKRKEYSLSRSKNRSSPKNISKTYVKHMENENENRNEDVIINKGVISKLDIFDDLFSDQVFIEQLSMTHKGKDIKSAFEECYTHHSNSPNPPQHLWEWKQKLNTWLSIKSNKKHGKQPTATTNEQISDLVDNYMAAKKSGLV